MTSLIWEQTAAVNPASFWCIALGQVITSIINPWLVTRLLESLVKNPQWWIMRANRRTTSVSVPFTRSARRRVTNHRLVTIMISWPMWCTKGERDLSGAFVLKLFIVSHFNLFFSVKPWDAIVAILHAHDFSLTPIHLTYVRPRQKSLEDLGHPFCYWHI